MLRLTLGSFLPLWIKINYFVLLVTPVDNHFSYVTTTVCLVLVFSVELSTVVNENAAVMLIYIPGNSKRKRKTFNLVTKFSILTLINLAVSTQDLPKPTY